jgi:hypothetical protein
MESIILCFSFLSLSAVLAGISVALRNFACSALLQPECRTFRVGEKSYDEVLQRSFTLSTCAGIVFIINTIAAFFFGAATLSSNYNDVTVEFYVLSLIFILGMALFLVCLIVGHLTWNSPTRPALQQVNPLPAGPQAIIQQPQAPGQQ